MRFGTQSVMRELKWYHGRAWLLSATDAWPPSFQWPDSAGDTRDTTEKLLDASARSSESRVAVQLMSQHASGASYFARLGAQLTPHEEGGLHLRVRSPHDLVRDAVKAGIESVPQHNRPTGLLDISYFTVHEVDFKSWAWRRAAATMCRLMCADVAVMTDDEAATLAAQFAQFAADRS